MEYVVTLKNSDGSKVVTAYPASMMDAAIALFKAYADQGFVASLETRYVKIQKVLDIKV